MGATFNSLSALCEQACTSGITPGMVVTARVGTGPTLTLSFGQRALTPVPESNAVDTIYDLASLTKALATSLLVARAAALGALNLDTPVAEGLEGGWPAGATLRTVVRVRDLLAHASGLPAHRPFYEGVRTSGGDLLPTEDARGHIIRAAAHEPLTYEPRTRSLYSDLNFILLGAIVERALGGRLDKLVQPLFAAVGAGALGFRPRTPAPADPALTRVAPTERCPVRGGVVRGDVHDLNAYAMGGVAGHAGLFGTAGDVAAVADALCAAYADRPGPWAELGLTGTRVRELFTPAGIPASTWRLGWDGPAPVGSQAGSRLDRRGVGHLAFTGCSLWIDPRRPAWVALLSNRIHPEVRPEHDRAFKDLRARVNDAALDALGYTTS